ncbi:hypothetical protein Pmani_025099 [Petrolisthes manimaculis]|uniref:Uncharacterized protein n=1 Tax=Petrolisthes manimaculis TaxID=1843537 RepID=A0AAE1P696_9EUCA|nr:hypothetical protein Pmani_025099 [Petrolisthes manimaculis]
MENNTNNNTKETCSNGKTSKDLLGVQGDGSSRSVVEKLLRKSPNGSSVNKPKTFKVARSPLLDQLEMFLPQMKSSTQELLAKPPEELEKLDIENTTEVTQVVEMNLMMGEMKSEESNHEGTILDSHNQYSTCNDMDSSDDDSVVGPVTTENVRIPSQAHGGQRKSRTLIQEITGSIERSDDERSDGEVTIASTSSAER